MIREIGLSSTVPAPSQGAAEWFIKAGWRRTRRGFLSTSMPHTHIADPMMRLGDRIDAARLKRDEPLAPYTTFRIGGPADLFYDATSADDLANAIPAARQAAMPYFVLGLGANILVGDEGFRGTRDPKRRSPRPLRRAMVVCGARVAS